jgi:hypothetical protein
VGPTKVLEGFGEEKSSCAKRVLNPGQSIMYQDAILVLQNNLK